MAKLMEPSPALPVSIPARDSRDRLRALHRQLRTAGGCSSKLHHVVPLSYTERPPPADLASWIACFWQIRGVIAAGHRVPHRVLPDGCADLLFDLEHARRAGGESADVVGPMRSAKLFAFQGTTDLLGVRLKPGAIGAFSGTRADELLDISVSAADLRLSLHVSLAELAETETFSQRAALLSDAFRARVATRKAPDAVIRQALGAWSRSEEAFPKVAALTRDLGLSERAFERRFVAEVGLTPVHYRRLARFRSVLRLHAAGLRDWAALAAATGFSDQSHLVRDCRAFASLTPSEWSATQEANAGFLQDGRITAL